MKIYVDNQSTRVYIVIVDFKSTTNGGEKVTNSKLLNLEIRKSGLSRVEVAKKLGLSLVSLGKKINNKVEFKASEIYKLIFLLDIGDEQTFNIFFADAVDLQ